MIILFLSLSSSDDDEDDDDGKTVNFPPLAIWNNLVSLNNHLNVKLYVFLCGLSTNLCTVPCLSLCPGGAANDIQKLDLELISISRILKNLHKIKTHCKWGKIQKIKHAWVSLLTDRSRVAVTEENSPYFSTSEKFLKFSFLTRFKYLVNH